MNYFIVRYTLSEDLPATWIAHILNIDLVTQGKEGDVTLGSARVSAREALKLWLQDNQIIPAQVEADDGFEHVFRTPIPAASAFDWPIGLYWFNDAKTDAIEIIAD